MRATPIVKVTRCREWPNRMGFDCTVNGVSPDLDNAIFEDDGIAEVERLLQSVVARIPDPLTATTGHYSLHEANGNYCGHFEITEGK